MLKILQSTLITALFCSTLYAGDIHVHIVGIDEDRGTIMVELFSTSQKESFPIPREAIEKRVKANKHGVDVVYKDIPAGEYAISIIHDKNSNGTMDRYLIGIPKEPYGNSGEYTLFKPNFEDSKFALSLEDINLTIKLH